jgi:hypothetical protein
MVFRNGLRQQKCTKRFQGRIRLVFEWPRGPREEHGVDHVLVPGTDTKPTRCLPPDPGGVQRKAYRLSYIDAYLQFFDPLLGARYERSLTQISSRELPQAKDMALDPYGKVIRHIIEKAHDDLLRTRSRFPDAACLFVGRPGGGDNFTSPGDEAQEDEQVHLIAEQIQVLTGWAPTVVTYRDRDAAGKIAAFRRGLDPYLVAINRVAEGCDIPRVRAVAFCRYTDSELVFRRIVGRALRLLGPEDGTAPQIYLPTFPVLLEFVRRLYADFLSLMGMA